MSYYRVAIIDDSVDDLTTLSRLLKRDESSTYEITQFSNPRKGLEAFIAASFDLYFIDLNMNELTAFDLLDAVKDRQFTKPVIVITGTDDPSIDFRVLQSGATDFVNKDEMTSRLIARTVRHAVLRKQNELSLQHKAKHDSLTGLAHKHHFTSELERAIARHYRIDEKFAVLMVDLDGFKPINDQWGHAAGDHMLQRVSKELRSHIRAGDLVGRLGGGEFGILLESVHSKSETQEICKLLERRISHPIGWRDQVINVGASIGSAFFPDDAQTVAGLLECADNSMYAIKADKKQRLASAR